MDADVPAIAAQDRRSARGHRLVGLRRLSNQLPYRVPLPCYCGLDGLCTPENLKAQRHEWTCWPPGPLAATWNRQLHRHSAQSAHDRGEVSSLEPSELHVKRPRPVVHRPMDRTALGSPLQASTPVTTLPAHLAVSPGQLDQFGQDRALASPVGAPIPERFLFRHSLPPCHRPIHRSGRIPHPYTHPEPHQSG